MKPFFDIHTVKNCNILIKDRTQETVEYIPEDDFTNLETQYYNNRFKYSDTYTINIVKYKDTDLVATTFNDHNGYLDESLIKIEQDGLYNVYHIILPSVYWLEEQLKNKDFYPNKLNIFVTDGEFIYLYVKGELIEKDPEILIQINPDKTTISLGCAKTFSICHLFECYLNYCKQLLNLPLDNCSNSLDSELIFKRDFLWMTINVVKYYIEFDMLEEAQRLLDKVNYCNQFCNNIKTRHEKKGCGCS